MTVITLLTDFGLLDGYPGVMKGVIWKIAPHVSIADITHSILPQDILQAALVLKRSAPYFPPGAIHVAVVDPGVGTQRRPIAARLGDQFFVGPDNGIFTSVIEVAEFHHDTIQFVHLDKKEIWLSEVSSGFHGRDIFSPVAAHLAIGMPFDQLGTPITDPIRLSIPKPVQTSQGWIGHIIHIDHFGNIETNFLAHHIDPAKEVIIRLEGETITGLVSTFGDRPPGNLISFFDSSGSLAIALVNGNAAQFLHARVGDRVELIFTNE